MAEKPTQPEWILPDWPAPPSVRAVSTTRYIDGSGGVSLPPFDAFNLAAHVGDAPDAVAANRAQLKQVLDVPAQPRWLQQVHGARAVSLDDDAANHPEADASVASSPHQVCVVLSADCLPVLFCDQAGARVAAAHAGWRGLAAGVLEATLASLAVDPAEVLVWLGPAIGPQAFEVGAEVRQEFLAHDTQAAQAFSSSPTETDPPRWLADLYLLARQRLQRAGVLSIYGGGLCTFSDTRRFFSYRRDGRTGRMASLIWLTEKSSS